MFVVDDYEDPLDIPAQLHPLLDLSLGRAQAKTDGLTPVAETKQLLEGVEIGYVLIVQRYAYYGQVIQPPS